MVKIYRRCWAAVEYNHSAGRLITPEEEVQIVKSLLEIGRS